MGKNYNLPPVMAALHAEQIKDLGTTFENVRELRLFTMSWTDEGRPIEVNGTCRLTPANIAEIFTYDAKKDDAGEFWAKGLAIADLNMQCTETLFWQQGIGGEKIKFHHRDALGYGALLTLARMKHTTEYFNTMGVIAEKEWPIPEGAAFNQELLALAREIDETRKKQAADVSIDRRQEVFPESDLRFSSGFELTAAMIDGGLKVTRFRVDSSLASAWETSGVKPEPMMLACFIFAMNQRIDPSLRRYTKIEIQLPASEVTVINDLLTGLWEKYDQPHRPRAVPME